jgi:hypothetical protein
MFSGEQDTRMSDRWFIFLTTIVVIQGIHVVEHVVQLLQAEAFGVDSDHALGLLGYVLQFQGTAEYLHFAFNLGYLLALFAMIGPLSRLRGVAFGRNVLVIFLCSVYLEAWHMVEHVVIISNALASHGCPCPGIGDRLTNLPDIVLHFFYNVLAYGGVVVIYRAVLRNRRSQDA